MRRLGLDILSFPNSPRSNRVYFWTLVQIDEFTTKNSTFQIYIWKNNFYLFIFFPIVFGLGGKRGLGTFATKQTQIANFSKFTYEENIFHIYFEIPQTFPDLVKKKTRNERFCNKWDMFGKITKIYIWRKHFSSFFFFWDSVDLVENRKGADLVTNITCFALLTKFTYEENNF